MFASLFFSRRIGADPSRSLAARPSARHLAISASSMRLPCSTSDAYLPRRNRSATRERPSVHQPLTRRRARTVSVLTVRVSGASGSAAMTQISSAVTRRAWDSLTVYMTIRPSRSDHSMRSVPVRYSPPLILRTHSGASLAAKKRRRRIAQCEPGSASASASRGPRSGSRWRSGRSSRSSRMSTRWTRGMDEWGVRVRSRNAAMTTVTVSSYVNVRVRSMPPRDAECDASSRKERRDIGRGPLRQRDETSAPGRSTSRVRLDTERGEAPRGPSQRREGGGERRPEGHLVSRGRGGRCAGARGPPDL